MVVGVSDVVERVRVIADDGTVGQRVVHDVVLVRVSQVTAGRGVSGIYWDGTGQGYATGQGSLAAAAAALRGGGPRVLVVYRGRGRGNSQRVRTVVDLIPVVAQRRPCACLHFDVRHVGRCVRFSGRDTLLVVRVRLGAEIGCKQKYHIYIIMTSSNDGGLKSNFKSSNFIYN